jgi:hypothetical protein
MENLKITDKSEYKNSYNYFNITITKDIENQGIAIYSENRTVPILHKSDDYEVSLIRFSIPSYNIPIFLWRDDFSVSLTYNSVVFTTTLIFVSNSSIPSTIGRAVYDYQDFLDMINVALETSFNNFVASPTYLTIPVIDRPTEAPILVYEPETQLISLYSQPQYNIKKPIPIYIYFSTSLFTFFSAFQNFSNEIDPVLSHYFNVKDNGNNLETINGNQYIRITQEYEDLFLWNDFQSLIFETDNIPVDSELLGTQKNITRQILIDFEPISQINDQSIIQFSPQFNLKLYEMISNIELRKIDIRIFWNTKDGQTYPLIINNNDRLTVKMLFKKKGFMVNNFNF